MPEYAYTSNSFAALEKDQYQNELLVPWIDENWPEYDK